MNILKSVKGKNSILDRESQSIARRKNLSSESKSATVRFLADMVIVEIMNNASYPKLNSDGRIIKRISFDLKNTGGMVRLSSCTGDVMHG